MDPWGFIIPAFLTFVYSKNFRDISFKKSFLKKACFHAFGTSERTEDGSPQWAEHTHRTGSAGSWTRRCNSAWLQCRCWRLETQVGPDDGGHGYKAERFALHPVVSEDGQSHSHDYNSHTYLVLITSQALCQVLCILSQLSHKTTLLGWHNFPILQMKKLNLREMK